jgi:tetratricopeptide (TPR) repeat protein
MDNSTPNMSELLVQYLDGELPEGPARESLEKELATDAMLQQQYDSLLMTRESVRHYGLTQQVAGIHQQMMKEMQAPVKKMSSGRRTVRYVISIAASLLLIVAGYLAYSFITLSSEKVYNANYQPFDLSTARDGNTTLTAIETAYSAKNYKEVIRMHDAKEDVSVKGEFLSGAAALEIKDYPGAITAFKNVIEANKRSSAKVLNDEAEYYLALSYIHNKDYDYALDLMRQIKDDPTHLYNEKITSKLIRQVKLLKWR